ncbi:beta-ketoacyl-ACP synthase III [Mycoplasma sp. P36-A1]|uniref:beta-ketoacyl-ACP synthase III n=1 Tax=Mycoplasma sp. P36-A1 TaxID=3252900 RepID=UPI003C2BA908
MEKEIRARIIATGSYIDDNFISNDDLATVMDTNDEWIYQRTGIKTRSYSKINTSAMATKAAKKALEMAKLEANDIDYILVATFTPDYNTPSTANLIYKNLNMSNKAPALDINAGCSGLIYGLELASMLIHKYKRILVIGAEHISKHLNFNDRSTSILFGDGASALILEQSNEAGIIDSIIKSESDNTQAILGSNGINLQTPFTNIDFNQDRYVHMKGQEVFKFATKACKTSIQDIMKKNNISSKEIDYVVLHQANQRIVDFAIKVLKMEVAKFPGNIEKYGNTSAASIGIVLDECNRKKMFKAKDKIILTAFGSGLTYGSVLLEW